MHKLKIFAVTAMMTATMFMSTLALPSIALAASASEGAACAGLTQLDSTQNCGSSASKSFIGKISNAIVNILSIIVGVASVIMIVIAGFRYVTSNGDSNAVSGAKSALIYALIGLVIVGLAQFLSHFVVHQVTGG